MTGVEKIIAKIEEECLATCENILANAQVQAREITDAAQVAAAKAKDHALESAETKCRKDIELAVSRAAHERKKALLSIKIDIINGLIAESMQKLHDLPDPEYFDAIMTLILHYAQQSRGVVRFSARDLSRLPEGFETTLNKRLDGSGKSVVISSEPAAIDGGFIIAYHDIEQNCSFESLLSASLDEIKDRLYEEIFMRDRL